MTKVCGHDPHEQDSLAESSLGERIAALRARHRLSMTALATRAGVSKSLVSQIERGLVSPSIDTLRQLTSALSVPLFTLFITDGQARTIVRAERRRQLVYPGSKVSRAIISPDPDGRMALVWATFPPRERGATRLVQHRGEEAVVVIRGTVEVVIGTETLRLDDGDTVTFDPQLPHGFLNPTDDTCELLVVISCPDGSPGRGLSQRVLSGFAAARPARSHERE